MTILTPLRFVRIIVRRGQRPKGVTLGVVLWAGQLARLAQIGLEPCDKPHKLHSRRSRESKLGVVPTHTKPCRDYTPTCMALMRKRPHHLE